eukprot:UN18859
MLEKANAFHSWRADLEFKLEFWRNCVGFNLKLI